MKKLLLQNLKKTIVAKTIITKITCIVLQINYITVEPLHNGHPGAELSGRCREVAVIERWPLVEVRLYCKNYYYKLELGSLQCYYCELLQYYYKKVYYYNNYYQHYIYEQQNKSTAVIYGNSQHNESYTSWTNTTIL